MAIRPSCARYISHIAPHGKACCREQGLLLVVLLPTLRPSLPQNLKVLQDRTRNLSSIIWHRLCAGDEISSGCCGFGGIDLSFNDTTYPSVLRAFFATIARHWVFSLDMAILSLPLGLVLLILSGTQALQVTPGSSCSDVCQSSSATNSSDIVCADVDYYSSSNGAAFKDCIECLQTSNATSDSENDVSWFLCKSLKERFQPILSMSNTATDNLRYASAVCLYDYPKHRENSTSSCDLEYACSPLQEALESGNLDPSNETEFGYCQADNNAFYGTAINDCVSCLQSSSSNYMANCR